jgi:hypothetical protein
VAHSRPEVTAAVKTFAATTLRRIPADGIRHRMNLQTRTGGQIKRWLKERPGSSGDDQQLSKSKPFQSAKQILGVVTHKAGFAEAGRGAYTIEGTLKRVKALGCGKSSPVSGHPMRLSRQAKHSIPPFGASPEAIQTLSLTLYIRHSRRCPFRSRHSGRQYRL